MCVCDISRLRVNSPFFEPMYVFRYFPLSYTVTTFLQTFQSKLHIHLLSMFCASFLLRCLKKITLYRGEDRMNDEW